MADNSALDPEELRRVLEEVCKDMIAHVEELTHADQAVGDGDHGLAIARGFRAARDILRDPAPADVGQILEQVGNALLNSMGGASGAVYGTMFRRGGRELKGRDRFRAEELAAFLAAGLEGVVERGGAHPGDKTLVDALEPAASAAHAATDRSLREALSAVVEAAEAGLEQTRSMRAAFGKARTLGDRAVGFVDPGALSLSMLLRSLMQRVESFNGTA